MSTNLVDAWIIHVDGEHRDLPVAYLHHRTAELEADDKNSKVPPGYLYGYEVKQVKLRILTENEGAVGQTVVMINRTEPVALIRAKALTKLTFEEKRALGLEG